MGYKIGNAGSYTNFEGLTVSLGRENRQPAQIPVANTVLSYPCASTTDAALKQSIMVYANEGFLATGWRQSTITRVDANGVALSTVMSLSAPDTSVGVNPSQAVFNFFALAPQLRPQTYYAISINGTLGTGGAFSKAFTFKTGD